MQRRTADSRGNSGQVRPCRLAEAAHRPPRRKAADRSETKRTLLLFTPNQKRSSWISQHAQTSNPPSKSTQCSVAEDGRLPRESGRPQRNGTDSSPLDLLIKREVVVFLHTHKQSLLQKHPVQCSGGYPTPMGIAGRVRPCRRSRSGSPHAPWKAGGRSGTERTLLLSILFKRNNPNLFPLKSPHSTPIHPTVKRNHLTFMGFRHIMVW